MRKIEEIIIHCSATELGKDFRASDIDRWHKQQGWSGIGYHFVIDLDGTIEKGRSLDVVGAHCTGHNSNTIGVCYIGGLKDGKAEDTRTREQKVALRALVQALSAVYNIKKVSGHNEYAKKACPCFNVKSEL